MELIRFALRKPITILVVVVGLLFFGIKAVSTIKIDIFPELDLPVLYLSHPHGGYMPEQMEAFYGKRYVNIFLFVNGVKQITTKNIQGLTLMKIEFYPGTDMAQAAAEISAFSNRIQAVFPPGSNPPFIIRFDASTLPVGQLVLSSDTRSNNELLDIANINVRSTFTDIPGLVSSPPFGGSSRTVVIKVDPQKLRDHNLTPDQLVEAMRVNNITTPSGNVRIGDINYLTPANTILNTVEEFGDIPLFKEGVHNLYMKDVATVEDGADIASGYALVNGRRSVYLSIAKSADASTWEVVQNLKKSIPDIQNQLPEDVKLTFEFDQSEFVINSVDSLIHEGIIGAILTGLMVLLFLGDARGALIVILTIPASIITSVLFLNLFGQTINIMTLSGLALAIGILVDESTVTIENIHQHFDMGKPKALAIWHACSEIAFPKLLILLCILAVFAPAFTMGGIPGSLFLPLALAIGFSMIASYFLSQTFVPVLANWLMKVKHHLKPDGSQMTDKEEMALAGLDRSQESSHEQKVMLAERVDINKDGKISLFERFRKSYLGLIESLLPYRKPVLIVYLIVSIGLVALFVNGIGRDVLPRVDGNQFQLRMKLPDGTRMETTEAETIKLLAGIDEIVGKENVSVTSAYVGLHPQLYSINPIFLWMSGPHEAVLQVALNSDFEVNLDELKDAIRKKATTINSGMTLSFEPIELTDKILSQGSPTPIEVRFVGRKKEVNREYARKLMDKLKTIDYLRDIQIGQSVNYPTINIKIDRLRASQLGVDLSDVSRSLIASTSSSRFTEKNVWVDKPNGNTYNVQIQVPEGQMNSIEEIGQIPVKRNSARPVLSDIATFEEGRTEGEIADLGANPMQTVTANLNEMDLATAAADVNEAIASLGELPRGLKVELIGMSATLIETLDSLEGGLLVAIIVIFLMLAANFQSFKVSGVVLVTVPAVLLGSLLLLVATGSTLNLQSYMGIIMSVGVSISNAVLLITNAEELRLKNGDATKSALEAASLRVRPIVMTAMAMVVGMIPMAIGMGEGSEQTSPLGRAVIGGLIASTVAALIILPIAFSWAQAKTTTQSVSLDPEDEQSIHYIPQSN
ncbi:efflux RND transporter permease subunit [Algoriphagus aquimarinus]|uniref:Efflux RND transporter permease subunit n=1 Tax=Algoriphagus aquimarinus TaxID=237018 RepID=A0A5C7AXT2_9BACT|nr:efflux RND transporter permease subunit [Algoriphagus aquimarinus]TXE13610.1 efflux RND transporter permease subunit [Algoriphagus aquimarinus]